MFCSLALSLLSTLPAASADSLRDLMRHGSPIRIVTAAEPENRRQGFLQAMSGDSLWYREGPSGPLRAIDCAALVSFEISGRQHGHSLLGSLAGGGLGLAIALIASPPEPNPGPLDTQSEIVNGVTPFLALTGGALLGAIVGSQVRSHVWSRIAAPCARAPVRPIEPGDRLRAHLKSGGSPVKGQLEGHSAGTLRFQASDGSIDREIPLDAIERIDLREPGGSKVPKRALIGGLIGGVAGLWLGPWVTGGQGEENQLTAFGGLIVGAAAGAALGAVTGIGSRSETWRPIPIEQLKRMGLSVTLVPETFLLAHSELRWEGRITFGGRAEGSRARIDASQSRDGDR